jgi:hypothetical protein
VQTSVLILGFPPVVNYQGIRYSQQMETAAFSDIDSCHRCELKQRYPLHAKEMYRTILQLPHFRVQKFAPTMTFLSFSIYYDAVSVRLFMGWELWMVNKA